MVSVCDAESPASSLAVTLPEPTGAAQNQDRRIAIGVSKLFAG